MRLYHLIQQFEGLNVSLCTPSEQLNPALVGDPQIPLWFLRNHPFAQIP